MTRPLNPGERWILRVLKDSDIHPRARLLMVFPRLPMYAAPDLARHCSCTAMALLKTAIEPACLAHLAAAVAWCGIASRAYATRDDDALGYDTRNIAIQACCLALAAGSDDPDRQYSMQCAELAHCIDLRKEATP